MPRAALGALAVALGVACSGSPPAGAPSDEALRRAIDALAADAVDGGGVAGLAIGVARGGEPVYLRGHGAADLERGVPVTAETVFLMASVSKMLTSVAVLTLVRDGRLSLDDPLGDLLPSFPNADQGTRITLRHLLTHTSGLHDLLAGFSDGTFDIGSEIRAGDVLTWLEGRPLDFVPGSTWMYSNTGYYLLGLTIEEVTGTPFGDYVREAVALPLGLEDTYLCDHGLRPERRSAGYERTADGLTPTLVYEPAGVRTGFGAAGGICSTVSDIVRLPHALQASGILPDALLAEMREPTVLADGLAVDYGLGLRLGGLEGRRLWGHTGGSGSTWATIFHYPDTELSVATLVNTVGARPDAWVLQGRVARAATGPRTASDSTGSVSLETYVGRYEGGRGNRIFEVSAEGARLLIRELGVERPPTELAPLGGDAFEFVDTPTDRAVFHVSDGRALGYSIYFDAIFSNFRRRSDG